MRKWLFLLVSALLLLAAPRLTQAASAAQNATDPCPAEVVCFDTKISLVEVTGDFYLDGNLVASGVNSLRITATPGTAHTIDVRNMQAPTTPNYGDLFVYPDQSTTAQAAAGWIWRVVFYPRQTYIKGTFTYYCDPRGAKPTDSVACRPTIDGVTQPDVAPGAKTNYVLAVGAHAIHTDLVGDSAQNWSVTARDDTITVYAGQTSWFTFSFPLKGSIKLALPTGLVADLYVDGVLIAAQAASAQVFTTPQVAHTVEARNVTDATANGRWLYNDASSSATTYAGGTRNVTLRPAKVWLVGTLYVTCQINRKAATDDAQCQVSVDGNVIGNVTAGTRGTFDVATGARSVAVSVIGASASKWGEAVSTNVTIVGGARAYYTARFSLKATAQPTPVPTPSGGGNNPPPPASGGSFELGGQVQGFDRPEAMLYAGMTWVKRQVRWHPGATAETGLINDAHAKGFKILLSVLGEPASIAGGANYADYARFVGELARGGADGIEVWNEMNIDREWPTGEIDPVKYTDLLRQAYTSIKANNPGTLVISGAPAPTGAEGAFGRGRVWNDNTFIAGMAAAGAASYMDCIGVHYNEGIISPLLSSGDPRDPYYTRYYNGMVSTYYNAFGGRRKLCFTELGYLTPEGYGGLSSGFAWASNTTVAQQAQWLGEAASLSKNSGLVRLMIVFNVDLTSYGDDPQAGYAIIRPGGGCPACENLRSVTGGR
jgi:hypothetical protein